MNHSTHPPDETLLRRFLAGDLSGPELDSVADYLDQHPEATAALGGLSVNDTLLTALRGAGALDETPPELAELEAKLADLSATSQPGETPSTPQPSDAGRLTATSPAATFDPDDAPTADPDAAALDEDIRAMLAPVQNDDELGRLGRYRVLSVLGRGGMGAVFAAEDDKLKRKVVLKVMLPRLAASPKARQRFVREAETAAKVEHDNIVPIYDIAEHHGVPFLAMPLLIGESLSERLPARGGPLATADVLVIGRQIAEGLAAAHAAGLIHRDIKPSNVWLERTPTGAFRRARILDFGLARLAREAGEHLTHTGAIIGTPAYMAPEQARGATVDHRADLFSLGCVLYQMTTGVRPFRGSDTFAILTALAVDHPPSPIELNPDIPPALSALVTRLLAKNPDDRWPSTAQGVADELARIAANPGLDAGSATYIAASPLPVIVVAPPAAPRPEDVWSDVAGNATEADGIPVAPSAAPIVKPRPVRRAGRGLPWVTFGLFFVLFASAAYQYGGQVIRIVTDKGELVIEVDDPNIEITVRQNGVVVADKTTKREYIVKAGAGEVVFHDPQGGAEAVTKTFTIKRGEKVALKATMADVVAARGKKPDVPPKPIPPAKLGEPRLPTGDAAPDKNAFPGKLVFYDTFDDPKLCKLLLDDQNVVQYVLKGGSYTIASAVMKADAHLYQGGGPGSAAGAVAVRVRAENGSTFLNFGVRRNDTRLTWVSVMVSPQGAWSVTQQGQNLVDEKWVYTPLTPLAMKTGSDADLATGKWVNIAARWSGSNFEVWLNGKLVAAGSVADEPDLKSHPWAFQTGSRIETDGAARFELDYAAVWDRSAASSTPPAQLSMEQRQTLQWVLDNGGQMWINHGQGPSYVPPRSTLPATPFTVDDLGLIRNELFAEPPVERLEDSATHLARLDVGDVSLTDDGFEKLVAIPQLTGVTGLRLANTKVTGTGFVHLKKFLRLSELDLSGTGIVDARIGRLAELPALRSLNLQKTRPTDAGLAALTKLPALGELLLDDSGLTDAKLKSLVGCKTLHTLSVKGNKLTEAGVKELSAALPGCTITFDGGTIPTPPTPSDLFNGKDLTGWAPGGPGKWAVVDGVLVGTDGQGILTTDSEYGDFELTLDYRLAAGGDGDGGVFLRALPEKAALELQLFDDARTKPDGFQSFEKNGVLYDLVGPLAAPKAPAGQWNAVRVRFVGSKLTAEINGTKTLNLDLGDAVYQSNEQIRDRYRSNGRIALQCGDTKSEYRNIRIAPVGAKPPEK